MIIFLALVTAVWKEELSGVNCDNMENARCYGTSTSSNDYSFSFISFPSATIRLDKTSDFFFFMALLANRQEVNGDYAKVMPASTLFIITRALI